MPENLSDNPHWPKKALTAFACHSEIVVENKRGYRGLRYALAVASSGTARSPTKTLDMPAVELLDN
jgi:hypothetical protein